jgi:hypothetical protein
MRRNRLHELRLRQAECGSGNRTKNADEHECVRPPDKRGALGAGAYENPGGERNSHLMAPI